MPLSDSLLGVAIPAAGFGSRMGGAKKAWLELGGRPLLRHSIEPFLEHRRVISIGIALAPDDAADPPAWLCGLDSRIRLVAGGATRLHSVRAALSVLDPEAGIVLVHDAARPFVSREIIDRCVRVAEAGEGAVAGWPSVDTLKEVDATGRILATPDRSSIWRAQTPQAFPRGKLLSAYQAAIEEGADATDDATLFARAGGRVRMVEGAAWNLKVTHPEDLRIAEVILGEREGE